MSEIEALTWELFDIPIMFNRALVRVTGSVTAALMLSQAIVWSEAAPDSDGWFAKSSLDWLMETGLSQGEQRRARHVLRRAGFMEEKQCALSRTHLFRVIPQLVLRALVNRSAAPILRAPGVRLVVASKF